MYFLTNGIIWYSEPVYQISFSMLRHLDLKKIANILHFNALYLDIIFFLHEAIKNKYFKACLFLNYVVFSYFIEKNTPNIFTFFNV